MTAKKNVGAASDKGTQTSFGYKDVAPESRQGMVNQVFASVADKYDIMNDAMSGGLHRIWKAHLINRMRPKAGMTLLDVAGGTGDIAFRFLKTVKKKGDVEGKPVTVLDINPNMLDVGRGRALDNGLWKNIEWIAGNAEKLPFDDNSFDVTTNAFGTRNVTNLEAAVVESYRILKPGGRYLVLEFSSQTVPLIRDLYDWYSFNVIPKMGKAIADDEESYKYLVESIRKFPAPNIFESFMRDAGFIRVSSDRLSGGVVTLYSGWKV